MIIKPSKQINKKSWRYKALYLYLLIDELKRQNIMNENKRLKLHTVPTWKKKVDLW